jgi:hypothetical protein
LGLGSQPAERAELFGIVVKCDAVACPRRLSNTAITMFGVVHQLRVDDALAAPSNEAGYSIRLPVARQQDDSG